MDTIQTFDENHIRCREEILEDLRLKMSDLGFFPLSLSWNDIKCFWIRLEPNSLNQGLKICFQRGNEDFLNILDDIARLAHKDVIILFKPQYEVGQSVK
jgi:hypothetical protein